MSLLRNILSQSRRSRRSFLRETRFFPFLPPRQPSDKLFKLFPIDTSQYISAFSRFARFFIPCPGRSGGSGSEQVRFVHPLFPSNPFLSAFFLFLGEFYNAAALIISVVVVG
jgi:hypothetical protein